MVKKHSPDVDIDLYDRTLLLDILPYISASIIRNNIITKHNTGVYLSNVPQEPIHKQASINYKEAEEMGYQKIDLINNNLYADVKSRQELKELAGKEPNWNLLQDKEIVEQLFHVHNYHDLLCKMKPKSIEELAMFLAVIRPGKKHLQNKSWKEIEKTVWQKEEGNYTFKKAHAFAYSLAIIVQLNMIERKAN